MFLEADSTSAAARMAVESLVDACITTRTEQFSQSVTTRSIFRKKFYFDGTDEVMDDDI